MMRRTYDHRLEVPDTSRRWFHIDAEGRLHGGDLVLHVFIENEELEL
jgi:hypothetical protein